MRKQLTCVCVCVCVYVRARPRVHACVCVCVLLLLLLFCVLECAIVEPALLFFVIFNCLPSFYVYVKNDNQDFDDDADDTMHSAGENRVGGGRGGAEGRGRVHRTVEVVEARSYLSSKAA